jgi:hypothetical protein
MMISFTTHSRDRVYEIPAEWVCCPFDTLWHRLLYYNDPVIFSKLSTAEALLVFPAECTDRRQLCIETFAFWKSFMCTKKVYKGGYPLMVRELISSCAKRAAFEAARLTPKGLAAANLFAAEFMRRVSATIHVLSPGKTGDIDAVLLPKSISGSKKARRLICPDFDPYLQEVMANYHWAIQLMYQIDTLYTWDISTTSSSPKPQEGVFVFESSKHFMRKIHELVEGAEPHSISTPLFPSQKGIYTFFKRFLWFSYMNRIELSSHQHRVRLIFYSKEFIARQTRLSQSLSVAENDQLLYSIAATTMQYN